MRKLLAPLLIAAALALPAAAAASTIADLQALGYTVAVQFETPTCKAWTISGYGISTSLGCEGTPDFQAAVDSIASPAGHCNRKWQFDHPDQMAAFSAITGKGYAIAGDQCADSYTVLDPYTSAAVYSGSGAGLVDLAASLPVPAPPAATPGAPSPAGGTTTTPIANCLPLCPVPNGATTVVVTPAAAGAVAPTATVALQDAVQAAVAPADGGTTVDTSSFTIVPASDTIVQQTSIVGWINSPYVTLAVAGDAT